MVTEGVQDDAMGECTSRERDGHTCKLMDALFSAVHESECCSCGVDLLWDVVLIIHVA